MKKEIPICDSTDNYAQWLISKFTLIAKMARLTPKWLAKMIITDGMTSQKKDLLTETFYKLEIILVQDFTEIENIKKEVAYIQKI